MKCVFLVGLLILLSGNMVAHDSDKAYFVLSKNDDKIQVKAELPWSIREAVIKEYPDLKESTSADEFKEALFDYVQRHFRLFDFMNRQLNLLKVEERPEAGQYYGGHYLLIFEYGVLHKIENKIMFNTQPEQENYHVVDIDNREYSFSTTWQHPVFFASRNDNNSSFMKWILGGLALITAGGVLIFRKRLLNI